MIAATASVGLASLALAADVSNDNGAVPALLKARLPKTKVGAASFQAAVAED